MSFDARESSRLDGRPFFLYMIRFGSEPTAVRHYTNLATEYAYGGTVYQSLPIGHGEVQSSGNLDKTTLPITVPGQGDIPDVYKLGVPSHPVSVLIRQGHVGDDDFPVHFSGKVIAVAYDGSDMTLECEPISASMRRNGFTREYQYMCPLVLYGSQCRASRAAATVSRSPTTVSGAQVTLPANWAPDDRKNKYIGGIAEWTVAGGRVERRSIVRRNGDVLTLSNEARGLLAGGTVSLVLGCDHTMDDCRQVHNNILNFGGQPEIPLTNPVGITNNYY